MQQNKTNLYLIPSGTFAVDDEQLKKKREELKKKLREGKKVVVEKSGNVNPNDNSNTGNNIQIPPGKLAIKSKSEARIIIPKAYLPGKTHSQKEKIQEMENQIIELQKEVQFIKKIFHVDLIRERITKDPLKRKREELKELLNKKNDIPHGQLAVDDEQLKKKREELKKKLREGKKVVVEKTGNVNPNDNSNTGSNIQIPPGKLAFYWYEENPALFREEIRVMNENFPQFQLDKLDDGRIYWVGTVEPEIVGGTQWCLQLVYDNSHPHNNNYGGSVKVYPVEPDLDELATSFYETFGKILPHLLRDSADQKYLCTSEKKDFHTNPSVKSTSAGSCLLWALKWIACYELLVAEEDTRKWNELYEKFADHGSI